MPKCVNCSEDYAEQLRRCPYCGDAPTVHPEGQLASLGVGVPTPRSRVARAASNRSNSRRLVIYAAALVLVGGAGLVTMGGSEPEPDLVAGTPARATPKPNRPVKPPTTRPVGITPGPIEEALAVTSARFEGGEVVVAGTCAPETIVTVLVAGKPAIISPSGTGFVARVPSGEGEVEVVALGVGGKEVRRKVPVEINLSDGGLEERVGVTSHAEGQTVHDATVVLALGEAGRTATAKLTRLENRIPFENGRYVLYRAPKGLVYLRATETGHHTFLRERDGVEMVLLPAGVSRRGMTTETPHGPKHIVRLSAYLMDRAEVTCRQYEMFLSHMRRLNDAAVRHPEDPGTDFRPSQWKTDGCPKGWGLRPVTGVSWYAAFAYARWVGGRLPTEAEWERGAAGPLGLRYPWGEVFMWDRCRTNALDPIGAVSLPAGASPYGLLHMSGNAREWCDDRFGPRWYLRASRTNPRGPSRNLHRVVRGGSHASAPESLRAQHRDHAEPSSAPADVGFRVVMRWTVITPRDDD